MFDLVTGSMQRPFQDRKVVPTVVSIAGHLLVAVVVAVPLLYATGQLPRVPTMMAFVAAPPLLPPPPPPMFLSASASSRPAAVSRSAAPAVPMPRALAAPAVPAVPIEAPLAITQETGVPAMTDRSGAEGGGEGGLAGGDVGSLLGGKLAAEPLAQPAPSPPPPLRPVRVGALIKAPELIQRVQPTYPDIAVAVQVEGTVILEATVDAEGQVATVRVLASPSHLLDAAAVEAVKQWRYAPLLLNGTPAPFVLTVTVNFALHRKP